VFRTVDEWILRGTEKVLEFFSDWLSLSQRTIERALIFGNVAGIIAVQFLKPQTFATIMVLLFVTAPMWARHRAPQALRSAMRATEITRRLAWVTITMCLSAPTAIVFRDAISWLMLGAYAAVVCFNYVFVCNVDGERGRKRRLALDEVKKMFGVGWIPEPVGMHG
jgi:hypothetical protein